jgi:LmbE family N-acetylglucosaminyl deacetylase
MKPTAKPEQFDQSAASLLVFGAHPDDIEFGCGGIVAREILAGRRVHFVVCSRGESASNGTPAVRTREARRAAVLLGASLEFVDFGGDAHIEVRPAHAIALAAVIRRQRPGVILAPGLSENQHPDHSRLARLVRDASRLARYGGVKELRRMTPHAIGQLFFYSISPEVEPTSLGCVLVDVSPPAIVAAWTAAMEAHASQLKTRRYVELQLTRARLTGLRAGVDYAIALYPSDPIVVTDLSTLERGARQF